MPQVKGGVPTWKSEYLEGRQRSHKGTAGGLAIQIAAAGDRETAADTNALSGEGSKSDLRTNVTCKELHRRAPGHRCRHQRLVRWAAFGMPGRGLPSSSRRAASRRAQDELGWQ